MALHDDLLDLAIRLVGSGVPAVAPVPGVVAPAAPAAPPKTEAELRRAISTAYYALFHLLINASTTRGVPTEPLRGYVARTFEHRDMAGVCKKYSNRATDLTGQTVPMEIQRIALYFVELQNARMKADYNIKDSVTQQYAKSFVQMAQDAFTDWAALGANPAVDTYLTELLLGGIKER
jgi:hypothetical protein